MRPRSWPLYEQGRRGAAPESGKRSLGREKGSAPLGAPAARRRLGRGEFAAAARRGGAKVVRHPADGALEGRLRHRHAVTGRLHHVLHSLHRGLRPGFGFESGPLRRVQLLLFYAGHHS